MSTSTFTQLLSSSTSTHIASRRVCMHAHSKSKTDIFCCRVSLLSPLWLAQKVWGVAEQVHSAPFDLHKKCGGCRASLLSTLWLARKVCAVAERAYSAPFDLHEKCVLLQREPTQHPLTCTKSVCCCRESLLSTPWLARKVCVVAERAYSAPPHIEESQVSTPFHQWLASVTERINQTMHYQFDGQCSSHGVKQTTSHWHKTVGILSDGSRCWLDLALWWFQLSLSIVPVFITQTWLKFV